MFFSWAMGCHAKLGQRETAALALNRKDFVQEHDCAVLHGEPNTGETKSVLGHGCESVVWHVAIIVLGIGGQGAQGPRGLYQCQSWGAESGLSSVPCQASCCSLFPLLFPSKTVILQSWHSTWHKWHLFPHLLRSVWKYCPRCYGWRTS